MIESNLQLINWLVKKHEYNVFNTYKVQKYNKRVSSISSRTMGVCLAVEGEAVGAAWEG